MPLAMPLFGATNAWITPPVVISVSALLFTIASFWWIQVRRGRLRSYAPNAYGGALGPPTTQLTLPLVFHNPAPASLVVTNARLRLQPAKPDGKKEWQTLYWSAVCSAFYTDSKTGSRSFASPFPVEGRKAVEKFLEFQARTPGGALNAGPYRAIVEVMVVPRGWGRRPRWSRLVAFTLNTQLAVALPSSFLPRSNDPDLSGKKTQEWVQE